MSAGAEPAVRMINVRSSSFQFASFTRHGGVAKALLVSATCVASAHGATILPSPPIRWDLALIHGLEASDESLGIRDRIRIVTLGPSRCTPRAARLVTINPESGSTAESDVSIQGRAIEFEIEEVVRSRALLRIECQEPGADGAATRTFTLALDPGKAR